MTRGLIFLLLLVSGGRAQPAPPATREQLIQEVQRYAAGDVEAGIPMDEGRALRVFAENRFGLTPYEISQIYRTKYLAARPWWKRLPGWTWPLTAVLLLMAAALKDWAKKRLEEGYEKLYLRYAWAKPFRRKALKRYRESLAQKYQQLKIPFRDKPLEMREVYVPLRFGEAGGAAVDALEAVRQYPKLMVQGNPGSGKTMLLKSILLSWADGRLGGMEGDPIPVLVELGRLNDAATTLEREIEAAFDRNGFPNAEPFVKRALERKGLLLLLDGLDEVNAQERARVVTATRDRMQKYGCRAIVTCRTQVYKDEFAGSADRTLEVAEFQDRDILRLLKAWAPAMKADQSVEQLMQTLRERPRILAMARNPLLLTMVAYLYADEHSALPYSRAEFYGKATTQLLERWAGEYNRFRQPEKTAVLCRVALRFQGKPAEDQDRRSVSFQEMLELIKEILPSVNIKTEDAGELLDEIVDRSGLLLRIDGGARYQFAHLTMQEYFAATALVGDRGKLLENFRNDRDTWREVLKLWCGITGDATEMIRDLVEIEEVTALECVADARVVKAEVADGVVERLKGRMLAAALVEGQPLAKAFGLLAASPGPRGEATLDWMGTKLKAASQLLRLMAARALAYSNLPKAALLLAQDGLPEAGIALELMGDVALRALVDRGAAAALVRIGTPRALEGAVSLLWFRDEKISAGEWVLMKHHIAPPISRPRPVGLAAARALAPLVRPGNAELSGVALPEYRYKSPFDWVWEPFREPAGSAMPAIAGRVACWLAIDKAFDLADTLDPTLAIPLYIGTGRPEFLRPELRWQLGQRERWPRPATREDWVNIFKPSAYVFRDSLLFRVVMGLALAVAAAGVSSLVTLAGVARWVVAAVDNAAALMLLRYLMSLRELTNRQNLRAVRDVSGPLLTFALLEIYVTSPLLLRFLPVWGVIAIWAALCGFGGLACLIGYRKERRAMNPLTGLIRLEEAAGEGEARQWLRLGKAVGRGAAGR